MAHVSVLHWITKHGVASIYDIVEMLDRGITRREIARKYNTDNGHFSQFLKDILDTKFILKPEVSEYLQSYVNIKVEKIGEHERKRAAIIQLTNTQTRNENQKASEKS